MNCRWIQLIIYSLITYSLSAHFVPHWRDTLKRPQDPVLIGAYSPEEETGIRRSRAIRPSHITINSKQQI